MSLLVTALLMGLVAGLSGRAVVGASMTLAAGVALTVGLLVNRQGDFDLALGVMLFWLVLPLGWWLGRRFSR